MHLAREVDLADAALEAGRVVDVAVAADDLPLHLLVALLALHVVAMNLLQQEQREKKINGRALGPVL